MRALDRMKQINLFCKMRNNSSLQEIRMLLLNDLDEFKLTTIQSKVLLM